MKISDAEVLTFLVSQNSLLDSKLVSFTVYERDYLVAVEFNFSARVGAEYDQVKLIFECVSEFDFTYSNEYVFGNVEGLKFLLADDGQFYFSLDPDFSGSLPSKEDRDFVRARRVVAEVRGLESG